MNSRCESPTRQISTGPLWTPIEARSVHRPGRGLDPAEGAQGLTHVHCAAGRAPGVVGAGEEEEQGVAAELQEAAGEPVRGGEHLGEAGADDVGELLGADPAPFREPLRECGEPGDVHEDQRAVELAPRPLGIVQDPVDRDARQVGDQRDVALGRGHVRDRRHRFPVTDVLDARSTKGSLPSAGVQRRSPRRSASSRSRRDPVRGAEIRVLFRVCCEDHTQSDAEIHPAPRRVLDPGPHPRDDAHLRPRPRVRCRPGCAPGAFTAATSRASRAPSTRSASTSRCPPSTSTSWATSCRGSGGRASAPTSPSPNRSGRRWATPRSSRSGGCSSRARSRSRSACTRPTSRTRRVTTSSPVWPSRASPCRRSGSACSASSSSRTTSNNGSARRNRSSIRSRTRSQRRRRLRARAGAARCSCSRSSSSRDGAATSARR